MDLRVVKAKVRWDVRMKFMVGEGVCGCGTLQASRRWDEVGCAFTST